ncbi:MAG: RdgB/HAM1 family non-canonical purine NTP pyrophosphatase [Oligoflexia bacterium]|nr:RdgB/HAM1 family non-canonical purine NTP pyrophosphatase [Oligoflexia bacterium]
MRISNQIVFASTNRGKFEEMQSLLGADPEIELLPAETILRNADKLRFAERYDTYLENATAKARLANTGAHYPCLADDSGLEVEALDGKPGVRSQRFATPKAGQSQDEANIELLLAELGSGKSRKARFVTTLVIVMEGIMIQAEGTLEGSIATHPRGEHGFGYDSVFVPNGATKTLAEMTSAEKNAISHRAKALRELMQQAKSRGIVFAKP